MSMSVDERSACIENAKWCPIHLISRHSLQNCNCTTDAKFICGIDECKKHHHKTLHGSTTPFNANIHYTQCINGSADESSIHSPDNILFSIQSIPTAEGTLNCLFDNAASCCLITESAAKNMNLKREPIKMFIKTVNGTKPLDSFTYSLPLIDKNNEKHWITAHEVKNISDDITEVDILGVKHLFSAKVQEKWDSIRKSRPSG